MADLVTTEPKSGDSKNNRLFKWVEIVCGPGVAKIADSDNDLLKKILSCTITNGGGSVEPPDPPVGDPVVDFEADSQYGFTPFLVQFTNLSVGDFTAYSWTFGDGNVSSVENPSNTYVLPGVYTVTLTATSTLLGDLIETKVGYIVVVPDGILDLESDLDVTVTGAGVSLWEDQTPNNNDVVQATDTNRPAYPVDSLNGFPGVDFFDGGFTTHVAKSVSPSISGPFTVLFVVKNPTINAAIVLLNFVSQSIRLQTSTKFAIGTPGSEEVVGTTTGHDLTTNYVFVIFNGASSVLRVNGVQEATGNVPLSDLTTFFVAIGAGKAFQVRVWNEVLSTTYIEAVESLVRTKYNL